jgi:hypothetical protein
MKKVFVSVLEYCGISFDKAAIEAADKIEVSEENMATINEKLAEAKGFKEQLEASMSDLEKVKGELTTATETIATLTAAKEKAEGELATATADLTAAQAEVKELQAAAGIDPTNAGTRDDDGDGADAAIPSWVDPNAEHYKQMEANGIKIFN